MAAVGARCLWHEEHAVTRCGWWSILDERGSLELHRFSLQEGRTRMTQSEVNVHALYMDTGLNLQTITQSCSSANSEISTCVHVGQNIRRYISKSNFAPSLN